jgi:hypothetical protein
MEELHQIILPKDFPVFEVGRRKPKESEARVQRYSIIAKAVFGRIKQSPYRVFKYVFHSLRSLSTLEMVANNLANHDALPKGEIRTHADDAAFVHPDLIDLPPLYDHCIDDLRRVKVICIGAGFSGVLAGIRFPQRIPNLDFTIYEKNPDVGGTWWENRFG